MTYYRRIYIVFNARKVILKNNMKTILQIYKKNSKGIVKERRYHDDTIVTSVYVIMIHVAKQVDRMLR